MPSCTYADAFCSLQRSWRLSPTRGYATALIFVSIVEFFMPLDQTRTPVFWSLIFMAFAVPLIWFLCGAVAELLMHEDASVAELAIKRRMYFLLATAGSLLVLAMPAAPLIVVSVAAQLTTLGLLLLLFHRVSQLPGWQQGHKAARAQRQ